MLHISMSFLMWQLKHYHVVCVYVCAFACISHILYVHSATLWEIPMVSGKKTVTIKLTIIFSLLYFWCLINDGLQIGV